MLASFRGGQLGAALGGNAAALLIDGGSIERVGL